MSKSGTGHNVEDMLSSVRRLVSDELPRMPRADVPKGPEALVLTESQRIEAPRIGHNSRRKSLEDRISELEAAVSNTAGDWEPDGSEDLEQHRPDRIVFKPSRTPTRPPLRLTEIALVQSPDPIIAETPQAAQELEPAPEEIVAPEDIVEAEVAPEVDLHEQTEVAVTKAVTDAVAEMTEDALTGDTAFEQALAEAVGHEDTDASETATPDVETETAPAVAADDLRPLIAAMIREELQGDLGDRITRNVRKLVRQEIHRALTVRELE